MTNAYSIIAVALSVLVFYHSPLKAENKDSLLNGEKLYIHYCSPCHGIHGSGDGFNAKNLDPRPAIHSDPAFMEKRTDRDLYSAIDGGGRSAGKSTLMPPWGGTLNTEQIKSLVLHLRKLCKCQEL